MVEEIIETIEALQSTTELNGVRLPARAFVYYLRRHTCKLVPTFFGARSFLGCSSFGTTSLRRIFCSDGGKRELGGIISQCSTFLHHVEPRYHCSCSLSVLINTDSEDENDGDHLLPPSQQGYRGDENDDMMRHFRACVSTLSLNFILWVFVILPF